MRIIELAAIMDFVQHLVNVIATTSFRGVIEAFFQRYKKPKCEETPAPKSKEGTLYGDGGDCGDGNLLPRNPTVSDNELNFF